jgi:hypothetical protein
MKQKTLSLIVIFIVLLSAFASLTGIMSNDGNDSYQYESIRGQIIEIYGRGIYKHMSADVAVQGIGQDYVTFFIAIPLLIISLAGFLRGSHKAAFVLSGTLGYFFVGYLFYTAMGMYNQLFLVYLALMCLSFFGLFITLKHLQQHDLTELFRKNASGKIVAWFLLFNSVAISALWLQVVLPPLFDGSIYPDQLQHYTTLIVQGLDLGLLLPVCFVVALQLLAGKKDGYIYGTTYIVFLSVLMTALSAKIIAMALNGVNTFPVIFIIPAINLISVSCAVIIIKNVRNRHAS